MPDKGCHCDDQATSMTDHCTDRQKEPGFGGEDEDPL